MPATSDEVIAVQGCALMKALVDLTGEKWVVASRFSGLADRWGVRERPARIAFLTEVKSLLRHLPTKLFVDEDARQALLQAIQEALDAEIDADEAPTNHDLG